MLTRKSTARTLLIGPILDSSGAAVTTEVVGSLRITKNGTVSTLNASATLTHDHSGMYRLALTTSDTDTVGVCQISLTSGTNAMAPVNLTVVETAVYDAMFAASAAGYQVPIWAAANSTVNLSGTTIANSQVVASVTGAVGSVAGNVGGNVAGNVTGSVGSVAGSVGGNVAGSVGSISGVSFPSNFAALGINSSGYVSRVVLVDTLTAYTGNTPQSGDAYPRLGAPAGASIAADIATRLASGSYTAPLDAAGTRAALGMTAADLDTQLDAILANTGSGAYTRTITVNDGTTALQGAKVRLTQGAESYVGTTNASGQVVFGVDGATWDVAITKDGYQFTPTTLVVAASGSTTYSMTASGPTPSADPNKTTVRITCYGADTEPEASATVQLRQLTAPSGDEGHAFDGMWTTYTADASGIIDVTLWSDATYAIRRGTSGDVKQFTPTGATDSFDSILSR